MRYAVLVCVALFCSRAPAALVLIDDAKFGASSVMTDTDTGVEWLQLRFTTNRSYNYMITQFDVGGEFESWGFASLGQIETMWTNAGFPYEHGGRTPEHVAAALNLQSLIGVTFFGINSNTHTLAFSTFNGIGSPRKESRFWVDPIKEIVPTLNIDVSMNHGEDYASVEWGNWLVRPFLIGTPEPSSGILALTVLPFLWRRRR